MMNVLCGAVLVPTLLLAAFGAQVALCQWPAWEQFKKAYVSPEGRVIDPSDARKISTSEGQSYGLFFALAANDRAGFDNTADLDAEQPGGRRPAGNICRPGCGARKDDTASGTLLDSNSASDS